MLRAEQNEINRRKHFNEGNEDAKLNKLTEEDILKKAQEILE